MEFPEMEQDFSDKCKPSFIFSTILPNKGFLALPEELLLKIFSHLEIVKGLVMSMACREIYNFYQEMVIKRMKRYVLKDQNEVGSLIYVLSKSEGLECMILDCRNHAFLDVGGGGGNDFLVNRMPSLFDIHLASFLKRDRSKLRSLVLKGCTLLSNNGFHSIAVSCTQLQALDLSNMPNLTSSALIAILEQNQLLTYLSLEKSYNAVNDEVLQTIARFNRRVKTLSLSYCSLISDYGIFCLSEGCSEISELSLAHCYDLSASALRKLFEKCKDMTVVSLEWCFNVDCSVIRSLAENCLNLSVLGVEHCIIIQDVGTADCISALPQLNFLSFDGCENIGPSTIYAVASTLIYLVDFYVNCCPLITDKEVAVLVKSCKKLRSIGIEECQVTDDAARFVAEYCADIRVLGLNGNLKISDTGVLYFVQYRPQIEKLYLSYTAISNLSLFAISKKCHRMKSLSIVGCEVDYRGLMSLGSVFSPCSKTLQDLHISASLKYSKSFYAPFYRSHSSQSHKLGSVKKEKRIELTKLDFNNDIDDTDNNSQCCIESSSTEDDMESTIADDEADGDNEGMGKLLNLKLIIFGKKVNHCKSCMIYYR